MIPASKTDETGLCPAVFISQPAPFGPWDLSIGTFDRGRLFQDFDEDDGEVGAVAILSAAARADGFRSMMRMWRATRLTPRRMDRGGAGRADLAPLSVHAGGDLGDVGDELVAQPHDVGRAGLLHLRAKPPPAPARRRSRRPSRPKMAALPASESNASFLGAAFFIGEPVPFGLVLNCGCAR